MNASPDEKYDTPTPRRSSIVAAAAVAMTLCMTVACDQPRADDLDDRADDEGCVVEEAPPQGNASRFCDLYESTEVALELCHEGGESGYLAVPFGGVDTTGVVDLPEIDAFGTWTVECSSDKMFMAERRPLPEHADHRRSSRVPRASLGAAPTPA